jgi:hypothetical protein
VVYCKWPYTGKLLDLTQKTACNGLIKPPLIFKFLLPTCTLFGGDGRILDFFLLSSSATHCYLFFLSLLHFLVDVVPPDGDVPCLVQLFFPLDQAINYDGHELPLFTIQVTQLRDGVFLGFTYHAFSDGTAFWDFINAFAAIARARRRRSTRWSTAVDGSVRRFPRSTLGTTSSPVDEGCARVKAPGVRARVGSSGSRGARWWRTRTRSFGRVWRLVRRWQRSGWPTRTACLYPMKKGRSSHGAHDHGGRRSRVKPRRSTMGGRRRWGRHRPACPGHCRGSLASGWLRGGTRGIFGRR